MNTNFKHILGGYILAKKVPSLERRLISATHNFPVKERYGLRQHTLGSLKTTKMNIKRGLHSLNKDETLGYYSVAMGAATRLNYYIYQAFKKGFLPKDEYQQIKERVNRLKRDIEILKKPSGFHLLVRYVGNIFAGIVGCYIVAALLITPHAAHAGSIVATPAIIDEEGLPEDVIRGTVTIKSNSKAKEDVYTFVRDIEKIDGTEEYKGPTDADRSTSLASWIEISRGVIELSPGEEKVIDYTLRINMRAKPGDYHAKVFFSTGSNRVKAEQRKDPATIFINFSVLEDIKERLQLKTFTSNELFSSGKPIKLSYEVENIGNQELVPSGEIIIFNRRGEEIGTVPVNKELASIDPSGSMQLASVWEGAKGFGRYKAYLDLEYGVNSHGILQDTIFFWVVPWIKLGIIFVLFLALAILLAIFLHKKYERWHITRLEMLAEHVRAKQSDTLIENQNE